MLLQPSSFNSRYIRDTFQEWGCYWSFAYITRTKFRMFPKLQMLSDVYVYRTFNLQTRLPHLNKLRTNLTFQTHCWNIPNINLNLENHLLHCIKLWKSVKMIDSSMVISCLSLVLKYVMASPFTFLYCTVRISSEKIVRNFLQVLNVVASFLSRQTMFL